MNSPTFRIACFLAGVAALIVFEALRPRGHQERLDVPFAPGVQELEDCWKESPPTVSGPRNLVDITDEAGIDFQHVVGPLGTYFMPESIGAGGAFFDYNGDGLLDLYLINCGPSPEAVGSFPPGTRFENRLFEGTVEGVFVDVTAASGLGDTGYGAGCAIGDIDNDGHPDVYITNYGLDRCYRNNGDGTFTDVTEVVGLYNPDWGTCAAFFDYDRDGLLDLIVVNYTADPTYGHSVGCGTPQGTVSYCGPHKFRQTVDRLYRNEGLQPDGEGGTRVRFREVTEEAGLSGVTTYGFGVVCADFTGDGWPDIFIANDGEPNRLWVNRRDGTFVEEALLRGVAVSADGISEAGMGIAIGDVTRNGLLDLAVTHLTQEKTTLYLGLGGGTFVDSSARMGLKEMTQRHTGWGAALIDLDHDGWLDLPLVNGLVIPCHSGFPFHGEDTFYVRRELIEDDVAFWKEYIDLNVLLMGSGNGEFVDGNQRGGDFRMAVGSGRSLIYGDFDNDGDLDLVVTNCGSRARLYRNDFVKTGTWLQVTAFDPALHREACGAELRVSAGERVYLAVQSPASSYLASHDPRVHFGLGEAEHYEQILVYWPDGPPEAAWELFPGGVTGRHVILRRGEGTPASPENSWEGRP